MFTVCPRCALPLAVTAADLRAGQGYVRCGRCANVFNALLALSEESGPATPARAPELPSVELDTASATLSRPALDEPAIAAEEATAEREQLPGWIAGPAAEPAAEPAAGQAPEQAPEPLQPELPAAQEEPAPYAAPPPWEPPALRLIDSPPRPEPAEPAATQIDPDDTGEFRGTSTFETIILEGDTFLQTEETIPEEVMASELADVSRRIAEANGNGRAQDDRADDRLADDSGLDDDGLDDDGLDAELEEFAASVAAAPRRRARDELDDQDDQELPDAAGRDERALAARRETTGEFRREGNLGVSTDAIAQDLAAPKFRPGWRPLAAAALLALVLVGQAINHWRDDLATHPAWYGSMQRLAALFGEPLHPNWDLNAYDVRQLGATDGGPDDHGLRVRLRLANVGQQPQALPLLRLTLLDRYGKAVSRGELQPSQYLPPQLSGLRFIARDQRIDTEVRVLDPSQQASSFELDVCVAAARGLRCAGETPLAAGHS
jgi:predicted Zn finger-like uncharacterized protein